MTATRRLAAILAADIAGYSRLMGADEEGTLAAVKAVRREEWDPKVAEHRGRIVKSTGDGLLVEFPSVVDAVRCAVELQRAIARRNADLRPEKRIEFRIGINLGDVILDEGDIFGDGVNIAARLEALAAPGDICVSQVVREQVRDKLDIAFEDAGEQRVKNIARPVHVFRVRVAGHGPAAARKAPADFAPHRPVAAAADAPGEMFVGRLQELEVLRAAFEEACAGHGRIVMLAGESGIGKTRTAQELAGHAAQRETAVLWGRCHEESGAPSYWPWVQIIRSALGEAGPELFAELGAAAADIADIVPEIRDLVPGLEASAPLGDPSEARFRMFESIRRLLTGLSRRHPSLIVLDDLHWADAPSLRLLEFLAPELTGARLLLVGTYRANELSRQHPLSNALGSLQRARHFTRINLTGLNEEEVQAFVAGAGRAAPAGLARALRGQTEGNPLFLREVVRFLEQRGALGTGQEAAGDALPPTIRLPEGVTEVIGRRLNLLSAGTNEVLALASVIGRDFTWEVLLRAAAPLDEDMLLEALDEAVAAHIVEETAAGRYQFTHNLVRMTLYDELRIAQRRQFHRTVGNAIEAAYCTDLDPHLPELARHFQAAGSDADSERAIDYAVRAARCADALLAFEDAVRFFETALDAHERRGGSDQTRRCLLLFELGETRRKSGDFPRAEAALAEAADAAEALGLAEILARAALAFELVMWRSSHFDDAQLSKDLLERALRGLPATQTALRVQVEGALTRALLYSEGEEKAKVQGTRAVALARRLGDPAVLASSLFYQSDFVWGPDQTEEGLRYASELLAAARQSGNLEIAFTAHPLRLAFYLELGDINAAAAEIEALTRIVQQIRQPTYTNACLAYDAMLAMLRGQLDHAERNYLQIMEQLRRSQTGQGEQLGVQIFALRQAQGRLAELAPFVAGFVRDQPAAAIWRPGLALLYLEIGRPKDARREFEAVAAHDFADLLHDGRWLFCMVYLSEVCAALGDADRAAIIYQLLSPYAGRNIVLGGSIVGCGSADRFLGLLCAAMACWPDAERHFEAALAMNDRVGARVPLALTRDDYAAMLLARGEAGDRERAEGLLKASLESAREIGMRALEERVCRRLDELSGAEAGAPDDLTQREAEVLKLIAIGRSNADIALVLSISLNTVATHVRNILAKTGCANRTEAAAYAMRQGLAP
jgi:class 3 adenylate cyclase/DNA-binding CsgD family transcriptional regulator